MSSLKPWLMDGGTADTRLDAPAARTALGALVVADPTDANPLLGKRSGIFPTGGGQAGKTTATATPSGRVNVQPYQAAVEGNRVGGRGTFIGGGLDVVTLVDVLTDAPATALPRTDLIVGRFNDPAFGDPGVVGWTTSCVHGTPSNSADTPDLPADAVLLASIAIPANATAITNAMITDRRRYSVAAGGSLPVTSTTKPASPYPGQKIYLTDRDRHQWWSGTEWLALSQVRRQGIGIRNWVTGQLIQPGQELTAYSGPMELVEPGTLSMQASITLTLAGTSAGYLRIYINNALQIDGRFHNRGAGGLMNISTRYVEIQRPAGTYTCKVTVSNDAGSTGACSGWDAEAYFTEKS